jgi:hypothetical protein
LVKQVARQAREHCARRGYIDGPNWNPLEPQDPVAALAMARSLIGSGRFDHFVAVAPEGHAYGFFFERLGARVGSVFVDYPPREVTEAEGLFEVAGRRVLLIEDDVVSGVTLALVVAAVEAHRPASVSVYLGRRADGQFPQNVPASVAAVFLAESHLDPTDRPGHEAEFVRFFARPD